MLNSKTISVDKDITDGKINTTKVYVTRVGTRGDSIEISGFPYSFSFGFSGNERRNFIGNLFLGKL